MVSRKKLIEVALPLDAINTASAREKSIRHGHPSTLHLWWARRPLAAARAVIFAQMVDDPSALPDLFPTEQAQEKERKRLFKIIEELVVWENTTNEKVLERAREEIRQSWRRACADNADHPEVETLFNRNVFPAFHDPFAGGGALPLEAQRLGLEAYASDLNPVAVLINKAMIEIPPKFAGKPAVNPEAGKSGDLIGREWKGAQGLAEDVRYYGKWMRDEAEKRIGYLYPKTEITDDMVRERPDLEKYRGRSLTVIAWLWARTVKSPNPAFSNVDVPLASTFMLSTKAGKEAYVEPVIENGGYRFTVKVGKPTDAEGAKKGTKSGGSYSAFLCLMSGTPMPFEYLRPETKAGRMGARLMAIVAEGDRGRIYLSPTPDVEAVALTTFSDLVGEARDRIHRDAVSAGLPDDGTPLRDGGTGTTAYAEAVGVYLATATSRWSDLSNTICSWNQTNQNVRALFARQAIPMTWDYVELSPFSSVGPWFSTIESAVEATQSLAPLVRGLAEQADARQQIRSESKVVSTDPPYYDNIGYADLSDFFYVWLRRSLRLVFPDLFATPYRHGSKEKAETFFLDGMTHAMHRLAQQSHPAFPVTIYYAFKQSESDGDEGTASTGWDTFLGAVIEAGLVISGTWPMRTEREGRTIGIGSNALASSIVLVCRKRETTAPTATRREFVGVLKAELPAALAHLQRGNIAPVDLAQAAIGPGMAVYTRYAKVLDAEGKPLTVREALTLINQTLDEALAEQEGDFDGDTRWALAWFDQYGFKDGEYGVAETLSKAKNTSVEGLVRVGIIPSSKGKVRLLSPAELPPDWDPATDPRLTAWDSLHHLIRQLEAGGESAAAAIAAKLGGKAENARELAYRMYSVCERKKRATDALRYNALVQSWPEIVRISRHAGTAGPAQQELLWEAR